MWHVATVLALPLLSLLAGLASLYIDPQREPGKKWILVALLLLGTAGSFVGGLSDDQEKQENSASIRKQIDSIAILTQMTKGVSTGVGDILKELRKSGNTTLVDAVSQSLSADSARSAILPAVLHSGASGKVTVTYYPKNVDGPVVINALKQGDLQVVSGNGNPKNAALATNAIWVGDKVSLEQAKFVALTLVRAGVGIVAVRTFKNSTPAKDYRIEVGTDGTLHGAPLTVDQIDAMTSIPRNTSEAQDLAN